MTRYIKLLMLALFAAIAVALPSCSDDDDDSPASYPSKIAGSWKRTVDFGDGWTVDQYVQFKSDGKYVMVGVDNYYYRVDVSTGSWSIDGDKLVIKPDDNGGFFDSENLTVKNLTDTELVLVGGHIQIAFNRVADATVEKYIEDYSPDFSQDNIIGCWKRIIDCAGINDEDREVDYYQFKPGGECTIVYVYNYGSYTNIDVDTCSWSIDGENLILRFDDGSLEFSVKKITGQEMVLIYGNAIRWDLSRVSEAEVAKYL